MGARRCGSSRKSTGKKRLKTKAQAPNSSPLPRIHRQPCRWVRAAKAAGLTQSSKGIISPLRHVGAGGAESHLVSPSHPIPHAAEGETGASRGRGHAGCGRGAGRACVEASARPRRGEEKRGAHSPSASVAQSEPRKYPERGPWGHGARRQVAGSAGAPAPPSTLTPTPLEMCAEEACAHLGFCVPSVCPQLCPVGAPTGPQDIPVELEPIQEPSSVGWGPREGADM